jgi:hypothetical protein
MLLKAAGKTAAEYRRMPPCGKAVGRDDIAGARFQIAAMSMRQPIGLICVMAFRRYYGEVG